MIEGRCEETAPTGIEEDDFQITIPSELGTDKTIDTLHQSYLL